MKTNSHMHDYGAHARSLDADLEYYYTKRLLPLVLQLFRKRYIDLYDFAGYKPLSKTPPKQKSKDYELRLRSLEDRFDELVKGINRIGPGWAALKNVDVLTDDVRKERGDYDTFFHFTKRERSSSLDNLIQDLDRDITNYQFVLDVTTFALLKNGLIDKRVTKKLSTKRRYPSLLNGATIVARAWVDPEFKARLVKNAREAVRELDIPPGRLGQLQVVEDTEKLHNVIVCTLCSCYPYDLLGNAPWWYKQDIYKTRIITNPRGTLSNMFKLKVPQDIEIRVHDSTSDIRYMVLPRRPENTDSLSEKQLGKLVTRECLIGVGEPKVPSEVALKS